MDGKITRYEGSTHGTFGVLTSGDLELETVERPWLNNKPFLSCVPAGKYKLVPFSSEKHGDVLCLVGNGLTMYEEPESKRYSCLIHVANWARQVVGCIGLGDDRMNDMVANSRVANKEFYSLFNPHEEHTLEIAWGEI